MGQELTCQVEASLTKGTMIGFERASQTSENSALKQLEDVREIDRKEFDFLGLCEYKKKLHEERKGGKTKTG